MGDSIGGPFCISRVFYSRNFSWLSYSLAWLSVGLSLLPKRQYNLRRSSFRQGRCRCGVAELIDPHRMTSYGLLDDDDDGAVALFIGTSAAVIVIIVARQGLCALG